MGTCWIIEAALRRPARVWQQLAFHAAPWGGTSESVWVPSKCSVLHGFELCASYCERKPRYRGCTSGDQWAPGQTVCGLGSWHLLKRKTHTQLLTIRTHRHHARLLGPNWRHGITWQLNVDDQHTFLANTPDQRKAMWARGILWPLASAVEVNATSLG